MTIPNISQLTLIRLGFLLTLLVVVCVGSGSARADQSGATSRIESSVDKLMATAEEAAAQGDAEGAITAWREALLLARQSGDGPTVADLLVNLGGHYQQLGRFAEAEQALREAAELYDALGDTLGLAGALVNAGNLDGRMGRMEEGRERYFEALRAMERVTTSSRRIKLRAAALRGLGNADLMSGDYLGALSHYDAALVEEESVVGVDEVAQTLSMKAVTLSILGRRAEALPLLRRALAFAERGKDPRKLGQVLTNLGMLEMEAGLSEQALNRFSAALKIQRRLPDPIGVPLNLSNLGMAFSDLGLHEEALHRHQEALALQRALGDGRRIAKELGRIASEYHALSRLEEAESTFREALTLYATLEDPLEEAATLTNFGLVLTELGRAEEAVHYHRQALALHRALPQPRGEAASLVNLGEALLLQGRHDQAESRFRAAIALGEELGQAEITWVAYHDLAKLLSSRPDERAGSSRLLEIESAFEAALDAIESLRQGLPRELGRSDFVQDKLQVYDDYLEHLFSRSEVDAAKALEVFERRQGRLFLEQMGRSGARRFAGVPTPLLESETALAEQLMATRASLLEARIKPLAERDEGEIRSLSERHRQIESEVAALERRLRHDHPDYWALKHPVPVTPASLQSELLQDSEALLIYAVLKERTLLWVVTTDTIRLGKIEVGAMVLGERVRAARTRLGLEPDSSLSEGHSADTDSCPRGSSGRAPESTLAAQWQQASEALRQLLIPSWAASALEGRSTLLVVPTGALYALPFEALSEIAPNGETRYLIEARNVAYLSSASLLKTLRDGGATDIAARRQPLLAFADPTFELPPAMEPREGDLGANRAARICGATEAQFAPLPETRKEALSITRLLRAQKSDIHLGEAASRQRLLQLNDSVGLDRYQYLLFATHGVLPEQVGILNQPALVLADPEPFAPDDAAYQERRGFLTLGDVFELRLDADLVALTACNSGRGEYIRGEGVMALTRAFMYAGSRAVAVTLWSVESESAQRLSVELFRHLSTGASAAEALRQAKIAMLRGELGEKLRHPYFWAPLVLFGEPSHGT